MFHKFKKKFIHTEKTIIIKSKLFHNTIKIKYIIATKI